MGHPFRVLATLRSWVSARSGLVVRAHPYVRRASRHWLRVCIFITGLIVGGFILHLWGFSSFDSNAPGIRLARSHPVPTFIIAATIFVLTFAAYLLDRADSGGVIGKPSSGSASPRWWTQVTNLMAFGSTSLLLVLLFFVIVQPFGCQFAYCSAQQPNFVSGGTHDNALDIYLSAYPSTYYRMAGDPGSYGLNKLPDRNVAAVPLDRPAVATAHSSLVISVHNVRSNGSPILIRQVYLLIQGVPALPNPLNVWQPDQTLAYYGNPYQVQYRGQPAGSLVSAKYVAAPAGVVQLRPGETDNLELQLTSLVPADVKFQVRIDYYLANDGQPRSLTTRQTFEVVFTARSNWHLYVLQTDRFVPKT